MSSAACEVDIGVGETQERDVTAQSSFNDTSFEDTPIKVQVWMNTWNFTFLANVSNTVKIAS